MRFAATVDGASWQVDTAVAIAFAAPTDTSIIISAVRRVSPEESQDITVFVDRYSLTGEVTLGDTAALGVGAFGVTQIDGDSVVGFLGFLTSAQTPGRLTLTRLVRSDSVIAGSFAFEAASDPDTLPHRHIVGQFQIRYSMQPVYVPESPQLLPNYRMKRDGLGRRSSWR